MLACFQYNASSYRSMSKSQNSATIQQGVASETISSLEHSPGGRRGGRCRFVTYSRNDPVDVASIVWRCGQTASASNPLTAPSAPAPAVDGDGGGSCFTRSGSGPPNLASSAARISSSTSSSAGNLPVAIVSSRTGYCFWQTTKKLKTFEQKFDSIAPSLQI